MLKIRKGNKGFSLVELIIVIAIMAILSASIAPSLIRYIKKARVARATEEARTIVVAMQNAMASGAAEDTQWLLNKKFKKSDGTYIECGAITNFMLKTAQDNDNYSKSNANYADYCFSRIILENLHSEKDSEFKFYKFNGQIRNPIGDNCEDFYSRNKCPGMILLYDNSGQVVFLEYYNYGTLIHYEDGEYVWRQADKFTGYDRIDYP